jgi:hypothetical protein
MAFSVRKNHILLWPKPESLQIIGMADGDFLHNNHHALPNTLSVLLLRWQGFIITN